MPSFPQGKILAPPVFSFSDKVTSSNLTFGGSTENVFFFNRNFQNKLLIIYIINFIIND